jgi:hypothetical protein
MVPASWPPTVMVVHLVAAVMAWVVVGNFIRFYRECAQKHNDPVNVAVMSLLPATSAYIGASGVRRDKPS